MGGSLIGVILYKSKVKSKAVSEKILKNHSPIDSLLFLYEVKI